MRAEYTYEGSRSHDRLPLLNDIARSKYQLKPGTDWASGYHFRLAMVNVQAYVLMSMDTIPKGTL